jgi:UTP-glucose-1-phosphate uridylyltransferase
LNYLKAVIKYALDREDIGSDLKEFLKNSVC